MSENFRTFRGDEFATFFGFMGAASALVFSCLGYVLSEKERERERERERWVVCISGVVGRRSGTKNEEEDSVYKGFGRKYREYSECVRVYTDSVFSF